MGLGSYLRPVSIQVGPRYLYFLKSTQVVLTCCQTWEPLHKRLNGSLKVTEGKIIVESPSPSSFLLVTAAWFSLPFLHSHPLVWDSLTAGPRIVTWPKPGQSEFSISLMTLIDSGRASSSSHPTDNQPGAFVGTAEKEKLPFLWDCYVWKLQQSLGHLLERVNQIMKP